MECSILGQLAPPHTVDTDNGDVTTTNKHNSISVGNFRHFFPFVCGVALPSLLNGPPPVELQHTSTR